MGPRRDASTTAGIDGLARPVDVVCDIRSLDAPDLGIVDALARLQLWARRHGGRVRLIGASAQLEELLAMTGLDDVITGVERPGSAREARREPEKREQPGRVEEEGDPGDPAA